MEVDLAVGGYEALNDSSFSVGDSLGKGGESTNFCYREGRLVRAEARLIDVTLNSIYSRVTYYDDGGATMADSGIRAEPIAGSASAPPIPSASALPIPTYRTARDEPFHAALQAAIMAG